MPWPRPLMQAKPLDRLTSLFVGAIEPAIPADAHHLIYIHDPDDMDTGLYDETGLLPHSYIRRDEPHLAPISEGLVGLAAWIRNFSKDPGWQTGVVIELFARANLGIVLNAIPLSSYQEGRDVAPYAIRRSQLERCFQEGGTPEVRLVGSIPMMTKAGVLDPAKLRKVCQDYRMEGAILKPNDAYWCAAEPTWYAYNISDEDF